MHSLVPSLASQKLTRKNVWLMRLPRSQALLKRAWRLERLGTRQLYIQSFGATRLPRLTLYQKVRLSYNDSACGLPITTGKFQGEFQGQFANLITLNYLAHFQSLIVSIITCRA